MSRKESWGSILIKEMKQSYFKNENDYRDYVILRIVADSKNPLGSWNLKEKLAEYDIEVSVASIGRFLKILDQRGYTELYKNQGRVISEAGLEYLHAIEEELNRFTIEKEFLEASKPKNQEELLKLMHARIVIEVETARLAALNATDEDIKRIEHSFQEHCAHVSQNLQLTEVGCHFHELIAQASQNRFLSAALKLLIHEEIEMEKKFPFLKTNSQGEHYIKDHKEILEAIKSKDANQAMVIMESHMKKLIQAIEDSFKEVTKNNY